MQIDWHFKPQGEQLAKFHASEKEVVCIMGPLGSGKTGGSIAKILTQAILGQAPDRNGFRRTRGAIIRNTYPDLTNTTIRDWLEVVPEALGAMKYSHPPEQHLFFDLPDGTTVDCEVIFLAMDRPDHIKKLRGFQASWIWMNEAKEMPKEVLDMAHGRLGRFPRQVDGGATRPLLICDYNAPDEDHWMYELEQQWRQGKLPDYEFVIQPGGLMPEGERFIPNPMAENVRNLRQGYYERVAQGRSRDWVLVNLCNEYGFVSEGKPVHSDYLDSVHGAREAIDPVPGIPVWVGMDFGLTPAAVFWQQQPFGGWIAFDEVVTFDCGAEEFAELLHRKVAEYPDVTSWIWKGDPSGDIRAQSDKSSVFRVLSANGIPATPCSTNDPSLRREALGRVLRRMHSGKPAVQIGPKCKMLRKALAGGWAYKRIQVAGSERYHMEPDKNQYSHVGEAAEYGLIDAGEKATIPKGQSHAPVTMQPTWSPFD